MRCYRQWDFGRVTSHAAHATCVQTGRLFTGIISFYHNHVGAGFGQREGSRAALNATANDTNVTQSLFSEFGGRRTDRPARWMMTIRLTIQVRSPGPKTVGKSPPDGQLFRAAGFPHNRKSF
jgi:hypothetical protein